MERNETPVSNAIKTKLRLLGREVDRAWDSIFSSNLYQIDPAHPGTVGIIIKSFADEVIKLVEHKVKSIMETAREALSSVDADENLQVEVKDFILSFFDDSTYVDRLELFVKGVEEKFKSWGKVFRWEWSLFGLQHSFHDRVEATLCNAREEIDADFALLHTRTTAKQTEAREEADRPISSGLSKPHVVKKMEMAKKENFFRKEGDFWEVSFDGKTVRGIKHLRGMDYIEYLLGHPGREVTVSEFIRTPPASEEASRFGKMNEDQLEELRLSKSKSLRQGYKEKRSEEIVEQDRRNQEIFRKRITDLEEIINDSESLREEVSKAQKEKEDLIKELKASIDKSADKPRKAVSSAITRAINRMKKHHSSLAEHLKRNIHPGYSCIYTPPIDPNWNN